MPEEQNNEQINISMEPPKKSLLNDFLNYFKSFDKKRKILSIAVICGIILVFLNAFFISAPKKFPVNSIYNLKSGQTLNSVANNFEKNNIIKSKFLFKSFSYILTFGKVKIVAGNYSLYKKQNVVTLAWRITRGELHLVSMKITIPEGLNSFEIGEIISNKFPSFDKNKFVALVQEGNYEGYLFPDTYFFLPDMSEAEIIKIMNNNFNEKIKTINNDIKSFGKPISDIIKMASIIEEEARTEESRQIISGILWKRIAIKMPLQVDSSFKYINGKTTANLTNEDLKIDSPYNSYVNRGLPPTPISNPGLGAIKTAISPKNSPYLYFLTDKGGNMHYAVSFEEHVINKQRYLK